MTRTQMAAAICTRLYIPYSRHGFDESRKRHRRGLEAAQTRLRSEMHKPPRVASASGPSRFRVDSSHHPSPTRARHSLRALRMAPFPSFAPRARIFSLS